MKALLLMLVLFSCSTQKQVPELNFKQKEQVRELIPKVTYSELEYYVNKCRKDSIQPTLEGFHKYLNK